MDKGSPRWLRISILVLIYCGLLWGGQWGSGWLINLFGVDFDAAVQSHEFHMMVVGVVFFDVLMAVPFVPGIEVSLALLAHFSPKVTIAIYAATLIALAFSYFVGRRLPLRLIATFFTVLGLQRATVLVQSLQPLNAKQRFEVLIEHAPKRIIPLLLKHRYIAVIIALNVPGNALIGGGGGIALLAGMSGLFFFPRFLAAVSLTALPVPLFVILSGD